MKIGDIRGMEWAESNPDLSAGEGSGFDSAHGH